MKLVHAERLGEAFDSQLVIGVRESYGMSCFVGHNCNLPFNMQSPIGCLQLVGALTKKRDD